MKLETAVSYRTIHITNNEHLKFNFYSIFLAGCTLNHQADSTTVSLLCFESSTLDNVTNPVQYKMHDLNLLPTEITAE